MGKMDFEVELKEARQELEKSNAFCFPNRILNFLAADFSDRTIKQRRPAIFYRCSTESQDRWPGPLAPNKKQIAKCTQDFFPSRFLASFFCGELERTLLVGPFFCVPTCIIGAVSIFLTIWWPEICHQSVRVLAFPFSSAQEKNQCPDKQDRINRY